MLTNNERLLWFPSSLPYRGTVRGHGRRMPRAVKKAGQTSSSVTSRAFS